MLARLCLTLALLGTGSEREPVDLLLQQMSRYAELADPTKLKETAKKLVPFCGSIRDEQLFGLATTLGKKGLWREAIPFWEALYRKDPGILEVAYGLAVCFEHTQEVEKGIDILRPFAEEETCSSQGLVLLAALYQKKRETPSAVKYLEKCMELYPAFPSAYDVLGELLLEAGQPERAYEVYKSALENGIRIPSLFYHQAEIIIGLAEAGKFASFDVPKRMSEAYQLLLRLREIVSPDAKIHNLTGLALSKLGRDQESKTEFETAVRLDPSNLDYIFNLSFQHQKLGEYQKAIDLLKKAIIKVPNSIEAYDRLVWFYLRISRSDVGSENAVSTLVGLDPERARSLLLAGNFYEGRGDLKKANYFYDRVIKLEPASFQGYFAKGKVLFQEGKIESAESSFLEALKQNPSHTDSLVELGKIYLREGSPEKAEDAFLRASKSNPSHAELHFQLGTLYRRKGELKRALSELELYENLKRGQNSNESAGLP